MLFKPDYATKQTPRCLPIGWIYPCHPFARYTIIMVRCLDIGNLIPYNIVSLLFKIGSFCVKSMVNKHPKNVESKTYNCLTFGKTIKGSAA